MPPRDPDIPTHRERLFVGFLFADLKMNATKAACNAGFSEKTAAQMAYKLMNRPRVKKLIEEEMAARAERCKINADEVLAELGKIARANMADYITIQPDGTAFIDLSVLTREQAAAIQEITVDEYVEGKGEDACDVKRVKIKLHPKEPALVDLAKHLGLFPKDGSTINVTVNSHEQALEELA